MIHETLGALGLSDRVWWEAAVTDTLSLRCLLLLVVGVVLLVLCARALAFKDRFKSVFRLLHDDEGTATVEFALVFPLALLLVLVLLQTMLLMVGNIYVHYAAFAATRSAIVQIPRDSWGLSGEPRNTINPVAGSAKFDAIRASAYFGLVPVCGRSDDSSGVISGGGVSGGAEAFVTGLRDYFAAAGHGEPNWVNSMAADRLRYAAAHTEVRLLAIEQDSDNTSATFRGFREINAGEWYRFGPKDPVTIAVRHDLNLSVPYVRAFFADGRHGDGAYTVVNAQYTLMNEGIDPTLPPRPMVPRVDPEP